MVPDVKTGRDEQIAATAAKYHPDGNRGVCPFTRGASYNSVDSDSNYYHRANADTALVLQIEAAEGIANLDATLEVPNVDCIAYSLGPSPSRQLTADKRYVVRFGRLSPARGRGTLRTSFGPRESRVLWGLGFDHTKLVYHHQGRDFRLTDVGGKVVHNMLAEVELRMRSSP